MASFSFIEPAMIPAVIRGLRSIMGSPPAAAEGPVARGIIGAGIAAPGGGGGFAPPGAAGGAIIPAVISGDSLMIAVCA